jgi:thiamine biosynthesis protein ThiS
VNTIAVTINGETRQVPGPGSLLQLLEHLGLDPRTVVVELNREIVRRPRLGETGGADGDAIELVDFVGGG